MTTEALIAEAPLTYAQQLLCLLARHDPGAVFRPGFINKAVYHLTGPVDEDVLRAAAGDVIARHGALRTRLVRDDGFPYLRVEPHAEPRLTVTDLTPGGLGRFYGGILGGKYPIDDLPLLRLFLGRYPDGDAALVVVIHLTAADGWSMHLVMRDLATAYAARVRGGPDELPAPMQYNKVARDDFADGYQAMIVRNLPYWEKELADVTSIGIPVDNVVAAGGHTVMALCQFQLSQRDSSALGDLARSAKTTTFIVLLAAYLVVASARAGTTEPTVPAVTLGRVRQEWDTIGFLLNGLLLRTDLGGDPTLRDVVDRVHQTCVRAYVNEVPLVRVLEALPDLADLALDDRTVVPAPFQMCQIPPALAAPEDTPLRHRRVESPPCDPPERPVQPVDFLWIVEPYEEILHRIVYSAAVFRAETIAAMAADYQRVVAALLGAPDTRLSALSLETRDPR